MLHYIQIVGFYLCVLLFGCAILIRKKVRCNITVHDMERYTKLCFHWLTKVPVSIDWAIDIGYSLNIVANARFHLFWFVLFRVVIQFQSESFHILSWIVLIRFAQLMTIAFYTLALFWFRLYLTIPIWNSGHSNNHKVHKVVSFSTPFQIYWVRVSYFGFSYSIYTHCTHFWWFIACVAAQTHTWFCFCRSIYRFSRCNTHKL